MNCLNMSKPHKAEQRPERGGNAGTYTVATPDNEKKESNNMANYYEEMVKQKVTALDLMKKGFKAAFGLSVDEFDEAAMARKEILNIQSDIEYYKEKAAEFDEENPTEKGEENG